MLTCYGHKVRLPQSDLAYVAFRVAFDDLISEIELHRELGEEPEYPVGYLIEVPFLEEVPLPVQGDLLAETWAKHRSRSLVDATLLDAAIVYGACETAARIISDMPDLAAAWLKDGPRKVNPRILRRAHVRLEQMFEQFWDDRDFLLIDDLLDKPPDEVRMLKQLLRLPDELIQPMYDALGRGRVSPEVDANLEGLLTADEIEGNVQVLRGQWPPVGESDDEEQDIDWLDGLDDSYHALLVGPCDDATAEKEEECRLVHKISTSEDNFNCTYEEWVEHFRDDVRKAAEQPLPEIDIDEDELVEQVRLAQTSGLENGIRIERRGDHWIVVDSHGVLIDAEESAWASVDDDEDDFQPATFNSPEDAYRGYVRSLRAGKARSQRYVEAMKRLGRES